MIRIIFGFLILQSTLFSTAFAKSSIWDPLFETSFSRTVEWGVNLGHPSIYDRNQNDTFPMASVTKMFIAGTALKHLGPNFQFESKVRWKSVPGGTSAYDFELRGSGDPTWGMIEFGLEHEKRLDYIAKTLSEQGIRKIVGHIAMTANDPRWRTAEIPNGWEAVDSVSCYGSRVYSINLDINCAELSIDSLTSAHWMRGEIKTPLKITLKSGSLRRLTIADVKGGYEITGAIPNRFPQRIFVATLDSETSTLAAFKAALGRQGIQFVPPGAPLPPNLTFHQVQFLSPTLTEMVKPFLKESINFIGEALFKEMGRQFGADPKVSLNASASEFVERDVRGLAHFSDGHGISIENTSSAKSIREYLVELRNQNFFPIIWDSLPIAGVDGTLSNRMRGTVAEGVVRAKTGTLTSYYHIAGYIPTASEMVPIVVLAHGKKKDLKAIRDVQDQFAIRAVEYLLGFLRDPQPRILY